MENKFYFLTIIVFLILTQVTIFVIDRPVWNDTAFTLELVKRMHEKGFWDFKWTETDVHPPTYYSILYGWLYLNPGMSEYHWAMELSVLFGVVFYSFVFFGMKKLFRRYGELAVLSMAFFNVYIHYFTEVRMYALVMMLSSILFYLVVVKRLEGTTKYVALFVAVLFPLVHYLAAIIPPFYVLFHMVLSRVENKEWSLRDKDDRRPVLLILSGWIIGCLAGLMFFIPQRMRIEQMWLPFSSVTSWPSAMIFSILYTEGMDPTWWGTTFYYLALILIVLGIYYIYKQVVTKEKGYEILAFMACSALMPLIFLAADSITTLYHHRYFLGLLWMFGTVMMVILWKVVFEAFEVYD